MASDCSPARGTDRLTTTSPSAVVQLQAHQLRHLARREVRVVVRARDPLATLAVDRRDLPAVKPDDDGVPEALDLLQHRDRRAVQDVPQVVRAAHCGRQCNWGPPADARIAPVTAW